MIQITEKQIRDRQAEILEDIANKTAEYKSLQSLLPAPIHCFNCEKRHLENCGIGGLRTTISPV